ncbi:MAG: MFS transporter [Opitutaceae bacterium]
MDTRSEIAPKTRLPEAVILLAGCLIALLSFGPRSVMGAFQLPVSAGHAWGSATFSIALAAQNLLWGLGQPFAGALADRFGSKHVLITGALLYAAGLAMMGQSQSALEFDLSAGVLIGFGLSGASFNLVLGSFAKLLPPQKISYAFGAATAAGSFGQFLFSPLAGGLIGAIGWEKTCLVLACLVLPVVPLALAVATPPAPMASQAEATEGQAATFRRALAHKSYVLLVTGFFTCGFQLAFITVHFQRYVVESGVPAIFGYWAFALVGIFNIFGSLLSGYLGLRLPRRYILSAIYFSRALATLVFISLPPSPQGALIFGAVTGLLWLSTVPPTSSLIGQMFGSGHLSMLYGFAFFSHQLGGFLGVLLGGYFREVSGSYTPVWILSIALGVISGLINLPIVEARADPASQPAE